ncbi:membrane protein [Salmonella enterica subsp. arizonae]|uniref:Membrane protein n=1 Tax=Salmonella enterica subsp. arizonae TaxID=59203 RepID=A0A379TDN5_SALER|nr:membrane protein [Salmonella enterica subsp. arizonae]
MKHKHGWAGVVCCFVLFIVVCLSLTLHVQGAFRAAGHPEIGLLFFTLPGAVASFFFSPTRGDPTADRSAVGGAVLPGINALCIYAYPIVMARTCVAI